MTTIVCETDWPSVSNAVAVIGLLAFVAREMSALHCGVVVFVCTETPVAALKMTTL